MNYKILLITGIGLVLSHSANSGSIYKCTRPDKSIIFTNGVCPAGTQVMLIHQETEQDIKRRILEESTFTIKRLIAANQLNAAKEYALKNKLPEVYYEQLGLFLNQKAEAEKQAAERDKQQQLAIQQQALAMQQQQLELQRQQIAIEKNQAEQQQLRNNQAYYGYPYVMGTVRSGYVGRTHSHPFPGSMNPPQSFHSQMNPRPGISSQMNPPLSFPMQPFVSIQLNNRSRR